MPLDFADIRALVDTGEFQQFIGEVEGQHLDAKSQPYLFTSGNDAKRELAKDVAAFANTTGGCIIVGAETTLSTLQAGEEITALKPVPGTLFSPDQYAKIIAEWLYPQPSGLIIRWYPDGNTPTSGIGLIFIPAQDPATKPYPVH
jgi:predicted HTH transcriptional regulator